MILPLTSVFIYFSLIIPLPLFFFFFFFAYLLISHVSFTSHYSSLSLTLLYYLSFSLCLAPATSLHFTAVLGFSSPRKRVKLRQARWDLFASLNILYLFLVLLLCIPFLSSFLLFFFLYSFPVFLSCISFLYFFYCTSFLVLLLKDECPASARFHRLGVEADIRTRATLAREHLQTLRPVISKSYNQEFYRIAFSERIWQGPSARSLHLIAVLGFSIPRKRLKLKDKLLFIAVPNAFRSYSLNISIIKNSKSSGTYTYK